MALALALREEEELLLELLEDAIVGRLKETLRPER